MRRSRLVDAQPAAPPVPHVIMPTAVYSVDEARVLLKLKTSTIRREVRQGRLRISKRAGRYYLLGKWVLEWIEGGEIKHRHDPLRNGVAEVAVPVEQ
jgi:Helix-turn-helix domain